VVVDEIVQVGILALEGMCWITFDGFGNSIDTLGVVETGPFEGSEFAINETLLIQCLNTKH
jgi:hypothetical protein